VLDKTPKPVLKIASERKASIGRFAHRLGEKEITFSLPERAGKALSCTIKNCDYAIMRKKKG
jgi:hypothetical protein